MKKTSSVIILLAILFSCRVVDQPTDTCFSCSTSGEDSCSMTDFREVFICKKSDSMEILKFSRCGAGTLNSVRFNYARYPNRDSASIKIVVDTSAIYSFPVRLTNPSENEEYLGPSIAYKKGGYFELPLFNGIQFTTSCTVSFILRSFANSPNENQSIQPCFQNIFIRWNKTPKH
jgi:hypothetical protein